MPVIPYCVWFENTVLQKQLYMSDLLNHIPQRPFFGVWSVANAKKTIDILILYSNCPVGRD